jgi:hypothetical protein
MPGQNDFPNGPPFSWSTSRQKTYENCPRQYWYQYYGYWGGWSKRDHELHLYEHDARAINFLKNRSNIPSWTGDIAHQHIGLMLAGNSVEEAKESSRNEATLSWQESAGKANDAQAQKEMPPKGHLFLEHLTEDPNKDHLEESIETIHEILEAVEENGLVEQYQGARAEGRYTFNETVDVRQDDWDTMTFALPMETGEKAKVFSMLDCVIETRENTFEIIDWKTGKAPQDTSPTDQLKLYTIWLHNMIPTLPGNRSPEDCRIEAYAVYLPDHVKQGGMVSMGTVEETRQKVHSQVHHLYQLHNELVDESGYLNKGMRETLDPDANSTKCSYCNWKSICPDSESA